MKKALAALVGLVFVAVSHAADLGSFTNTDMVTGLKDALNQGASAAVGKLGQENGFLGDPKVKIPLPATLQKAEKAMRTFGMGKQADELVTAMNRAAEAAVPEAKALLLDSVKKMSVDDAKGILTGGDNAATQYFRKTTEAPLTTKFLPIVKQSTQKVGLAEQYNEFAATGSRFGLVKGEDAKLENYVTRKALDGLYLMMAEEEKALRANPVHAGSALVKKLFSALR